MASIMVVEDERIVSLFLQRALVSLGHEVPVVAVSGDEALTAARRSRVDLALLDIGLEGAMDGITLCERLARDHQIGSVFLSSHSDAETLARADRAGALGYIVKPFETPQLDVMLRIALARDRSRREVESLVGAYRLMMRDAEVPCAELDGHGRVLFATATLANALGQPLEAVVGQPLAAPSAWTRRELPGGGCLVLAKPPRRHTSG